MHLDPRVTIADDKHRSSHSNIDKVDATMEAIHEQRAIANEISEAISSPMGAGLEFDEVCCAVYEIKSSNLTLL